MKQHSKKSSNNQSRISYAQLLRTRKHPIARYNWWFGKLRKSRRRKLELLYEKQQGLCFYCQKTTILYDPGLNVCKEEIAATLEHLIPQSQGGTDRLSNLVMACGRCNHHRQSMGYKEYLEKVQAGETRILTTNKERRKISKRNRITKKSEDPKVQERVWLRIWQLAILFHYNKGWLSVADEIIEKGPQHL